MTEAEFTRRFTARCLAMCGFDAFDDGQSVADYCADVAPSYWSDAHYRDDGPEECADSDMSYWKEE